MKLIHICKEEFFDTVFEGSNATLGFHYAVSKNSIGRLNESSKQYYSKI